MMTMNGNSVTPPVPYRRRKHKNLVNSLKESDTDNDSKFQHKERSALDSHKRKEFSTWEQKKKCSPLVQRMCERFESSDISKGKGSECTNEMKFDVKNLHHDEVDFKNDQHQKVKGHSGHHGKSKDCFYVIGEKSEATSATVGKLAKSSSLDIPLQNEKKEQQSNCVSSVCMEQVTINKINHAHKTNSIKQLGVGCKDSTNCDYSAQKLASYSSSEPKSEEATREKRQYSHKCGRNEDKIGITSQFISIFQKQNVNIPEENRGIQTAFKGVVKKQTIDSEEDSANSFLKGTQMALRKKKGFPPSKPPRTFAHDIYKESKIKSTAFVFENLEHDENTKRKGVSSTTKEKHKSTDDFAKRTHVKQVVKQKPVTPPKPPQFVYLEDKICLPTNVEVCCDSRAMIQSTVSPLKEEKQYQGRFLAEFSMFQDGIEPYAVSHHLPLKNRSISSRIDSDLHNQLYDNANQNDLKIFVDLTPTTVSPPKHYGTLKRHFSDEHIYAEPFGSCDHSQMKKTFVEDCTYSSPVDVVRKQNGLHYMCSPLPFCQNDNELRTSKGVKQAVLTASPRLKKMGVTHVKELINNSFGVIRRQFQGLASNEMVDGDDEDDSKGDSDNEVSDGDVQNRIIYVRSLKKQVSYAKGPESNSIFCSVILVAVRKDAQGQPQPYVALRYPKQENLVYDSNILSHLCFPDANSLKPTSVYKSESFFFMLFDEKDEKIHGYCCRLLGGPSQPSTSFVTFPAAVCIFSVSCLLPFYLKLLGELEKCFSHPELVWCNILTLLHKSKLPTPGEALSVSYQNIMEISVIRPLEDAKFRGKLTKLIQLLDVDLLLKVMASQLLERRVLFFSQSISTLFDTITAVLSLLYPFSWQHLVIPCLPTCLLVQCCVTTPYLIGVLSSSAHTVMEILDNKVLVVDIDQANLLQEIGDEDSILPGRIQKALRMALSLAKNMTDPTEMLRDVMISEAFIRMFVEIVGHTESSITQGENEELTFQKDSFCKYLSSRSIQKFLQWFTETQMFDIFVEEQKSLKCKKRLWEKQFVQPHHMSLFDRRVLEFDKESEQMTSCLRGNVRDIGKFVKTFGEKLKHLKAF